MTFFGLTMKKFVFVVRFAVCSCFVGAVSGVGFAQASNSAAEEALRKLKAAAIPPTPAPLPPGQQKTSAQAESEQQQQAAAFRAAAKQAKDFQTQFPIDPNLSEV